MKRLGYACSIAAALLASSGCASKQAYIAKGNALFEQAKYQDASLTYRKAIQKNPGFGEAYYRLGLAAIKLDQARQAYDALLRAVQIMPENVDAQEALADVCLTVYLADPRHSQVLYTHLIQIADTLYSKNHNSYKALVLKGYLASTDRQPAKAIEFFRSALQIDSSNPGVATELAHILIQQGQVQQGEELAMDLIARQRTSYGPAYDLLYIFYLDAQRTSDAEAILKLKVKNNPKQAGYIAQLARHYGRMQQKQAMRAVLQQLLDDPANFPDARLQVGDFYLERKEHAEAVRYYQAGLGANPSANIKLAYQKRTVIALVGQGNREDALRLAEQIVKENPTDNEALHLHAGILLDTGKRENAELAAHEFQTLTRRDPEDAALRLQQAQAYRLKGDLNSARSELLECINKRKDLIAARYELAEISLIEQRPAEAVQQANQILELRSNDRRARLLRTAGRIGSGDGAMARTELIQLMKEFPQDVEPRWQMGLLAAAEKKYAEAIEILAKYRGNGDPRISRGLAIAYLHQNQLDQARETLNAGLKNLPDSPMLLEQLANTEALAGHYDLAVGYLQKLLASDPKAINPRLRLAEVYGLKGDQSNELAMYRQAAAVAPNDLRVVLSLAEALAHAGRMNEARTQFQLVVQGHPENGPALNNAAYFLADTGGDLDEALRLAQHALAQVPNQPLFSDTVGYIYLKKGLHDSALETFTNLARKYPTQPAFRYHLGMALYARGEKTAAKRELQAALSNHPSAEDQVRIRELLEKISGSRS